MKYIGLIKNINNIVKVYEHVLHENIVKNNYNIKKLIKTHDDKLLEINKHIDRIISIYELKLKKNSDIIKKYITNTSNKRWCC